MASAVEQITTSPSAAIEHGTILVDLAESVSDNESLSLDQEGIRTSDEHTEPIPPGKVAYYRYRHHHRAIAWRWQRAHELLEIGGAIDPLRDDAQVEQIRRYLRLAQQDPKEAAQTYPELASAQQIHDEDGRQDALIRAWLLTELSSLDVAARLDVPLEIVEAYAMMYFDVQDRRSCRGWVISHVIRLHSRRFQDFEEMEFATWQLEALDGAGALAELLELARLAVYRGVETCKDIDEQIVRIWKYRLYVLLVTTPIWSGNPATWQRLYLEQRMLELARQRQRLMKRPNPLKTRQDANRCSTRSGNGSGEASELIESILLSLRPYRSAGPESLLRP